MAAVADDLPSDLYLVDELVADRDGVLHKTYEVLHCPTELDARGRKWFRCGLCGLSFPVEKGMKIQGKMYCLEFECAREKLAVIEAQRRRG